MLYGLATCDTTRAARKWLDGQGVSYAFHDVRTGGLTRAMVEGWVKKLGWEKEYTRLLLYFPMHVSIHLRIFD